MKKGIFLLALLLTLSVTIRAGGFQVALQGQRQTGMGLLGTGFLQGPSIAFYNPGGMSFMQEKFAISMGISPIMSTVAFQYQQPSTYNTQTDNPVSLPFSFYGTGKISEKLSLGLGVYTPYGSSTVWGDDWRGKYIIQDISLLSIYIQPTLSYKITEQIGIGVGFIYAYGQVELNKALPLTDAEGETGQSNIEGSTANYGFNAGLYFQPSEQFSLGVTYRSKINMKVEKGDVTFDVPESMQSYFPADNSYNTELPLPASINVGASFQVNSKLRLGADFNYVFWSEYESLDFDFENNTDILTDLEQPKNYENGAIYRIGAEYNLSELLDIRAGFYYDSPVADEEYYAPETPDAKKLGLTAGLSIYPSEKLAIDLSFLYNIGLERTTYYKPENFGGTYKYNAFIPGIGVSYKF